MSESRSRESAPSGALPGHPLDGRDGLVGREPLIVRRHVRWGDCDPANVVYTPQFAHYAVDAIQAFCDEILGPRPYRDGTGAEISFPMKAMSLEFVSFLGVGDVVDMTVRVGNIRQRTFDLRITAKKQDLVVFRVLASPIAFDWARRVGVRIPDPLRLAIAAYAERCPE